MEKQVMDSAGPVPEQIEFLITGDIDALVQHPQFDEIMTPNTMSWTKIEKDQWIYYQVGNDEFYYSVEPPGLQMMFNDTITYQKAKQIADEVIHNIVKCGLSVELAEI